MLGGPSDNTELTLRPGREIELHAIAQLRRERSLRRGASLESATQFAAKTTHIRQEGDITNHMAAGLPRRSEDTANPLLGAFADATGSRPPALRVDWAPSEHRIHVVAGLLDDECWASDSHPNIRWLTLDQMRKLNTPLHDTAAIALASCTLLQAQR